MRALDEAARKSGTTTYVNVERIAGPGVKTIPRPRQLIPENTVRAYLERVAQIGPALTDSMIPADVRRIMSSLGIGLLASTVANTQQEAMLTVWMTLLPSIFLSGFFFPLEAMPRILQWISYLMPLRYYLVIIRSLLLKGVGLEMIQFDVLAMTLFAVGIMTAAALRFRKRLD